MKDALGHGSDASGAAHQAGVASAARTAAFNVARATAERLTAEVSQAGETLRAFPKGPMGLTPDAVKSSSEYRAARSAFDTANTQSRAFNSRFVKEFASELRASRMQRRSAGP